MHESQSPPLFVGVTSGVAALAAGFAAAVAAKSGDSVLALCLAALSAATIAVTVVLSRAGARPILRPCGRVVLLFAFYCAGFGALMRLMDGDPMTLDGIVRRGAFFAAAMTFWNTVYPYRRED